MKDCVNCCVVLSVMILLILFPVFPMVQPFLLYRGYGSDGPFWKFVQF